MHGTGFFADIRYADILQLIWPILIPMPVYIKHFFPIPNCRDHEVSSVVEYTYSIII